MHFGVRNAYYLRISANTVLPLYLYLDDRHLDWMSERILQHVLEDLRPRILTKLKDEADAHLGPGGPANAKRGVVDVHRGDSYQFGYFLRKTDPHSVLVKTRQFVAAPPHPQEPPPKSKSPSPEPSTRKRKKRAPKNAAAAPKGGKKPKTKGKQRAQELEEDDVISISSDDEEDKAAAPSMSAPPRRSARAKKVVAGGYRDLDDDADRDDDHDGGPTEVPSQPHTAGVDADVEMTSPGEDDHNYVAPLEPMPLDIPGLISLDEDEVLPTPAVKPEAVEPVLLQDVPSIPHDEPPGEPMDIAPELDLEVEETEEKPKPVMQLTYQGFNMQGRCLCVIVEPWPPTRETTRTPSLAPHERAATRAPSIAPPDFVPSGGAGQRERTPLFLPEYDHERSVTPAPSHVQRTLPPVPLFHADLPENSDSDDDGLMQFSQILRSVGEHQTGAVGDDDEIDGAVFFGDADENREL